MKVLIVGHSPGKVKPEKSITRKRVIDWLKRAGIIKFSWHNLVDYHAPKLNLKQVTLDPQVVNGFDRVISLGVLAHTWLSRQSIEHYPAPHPSGLNRQWNDPATEPRVINEIQQYLQREKISNP